MSYDTGMSSKMKEFESKHSSSVVVGGGIEKKEKQDIINCCNYIIDTYNDENISEEIKNEINIDNITEIQKKLDECFLPKEEIELFKNYIYNLTHCINCMLNPAYPSLIYIADKSLNECKLYFQIQTDKFAREYEENKISNQINIVSSMKSRNSMLSSMSGADSKKMASSIMTSMSKLNDSTKLLQDKKLQSRPQKDEKQIQYILNAFIGLYNNYYDTQKIETEDTQKQTKLDERKEKREAKINKHLKKSIDILLYPTERDKKPNPKKENKSNYDISLEKFNNCIVDICKKYNVENINELIQKTSGTDIGKFARQIQSFQMCCAARETQEMFMENNLGAGIF